MTAHEAPPGAIIPPRIGPIWLDLPDGWWLIRGDNAAVLSSDEWEVTTPYRLTVTDDAWRKPDAYETAYDTAVIVRRCKVQVTVDATPGDRVVVLDEHGWRWLNSITSIGSGTVAPSVATRIDTRDAIDAAVVAE